MHNQTNGMHLACSLHKHRTQLPFLNLNILCLLLLCIQPIEPSYCVGALDEISQNLSSNLYPTLLSKSLFFSFKNNNSVVMGIVHSMIHFKNSISPICI